MFDLFQAIITPADYLHACQVMSLVSQQKTNDAIELQSRSHLALSAYEVIDIWHTAVSLEKTEGQIRLIQKIHCDLLSSSVCVEGVQISEKDRKTRSA